MRFKKLFLIGAIGLLFGVKNVFADDPECFIGATNSAGAKYDYNDENFKAAVGDIIRVDIGVEEKPSETEIYSFNYILEYDSDYLEYHDTWTDSDLGWKFSNINVVEDGLSIVLSTDESTGNKLTKDSSDLNSKSIGYVLFKVKKNDGNPIKISISNKSKFNSIKNEDAEIDVDCGNKTTMIYMANVDSISNSTSSNATSSNATSSNATSSNVSSNNPKTGINDYVALLGTIIGISSVVFVIMKKRNKFLV